jgi:zinc/manganese transport system substrate-binding protein
MNWKAFAGGAVALVMSVLSAMAGGPISVVAAENFYGALAAAIGGDKVVVTSILSSPDQDPHLFETSPSTARGVAGAKLVILNGADYDPWMEKLLGASKADGRMVVNAAGLVGKKAGDNPHLWYDPATMPAVAKAVAAALSAIDPSGASGYEARRAAYVAALAPVTAKIAGIRQRFAGAPVTATEPVFGYMADALGLDMRNKGFQMDVMNETEPSAREIAAMEADLKDKKVRALFFNAQVSEPMTEHLKALAEQSGVPVVGVTETMPSGVVFADWMLGQLEAAEKALAGPSS